MSETLTTAEWNCIERELRMANTMKLKFMRMTVKEVRILYDLARRAPVPAVDPSGDTVAGLIEDSK
jgi:hypothetical protein